MSTQENMKVVQTFVNSAQGVTLYLGCAIALQAKVEAELKRIGKELPVRESDGRKLYPSMAINLPNTIGSIRFIKRVADMLLEGKHVITFSYNDLETPRLYETTNGNIQFGLSTASFDLNSIEPFVSRVELPTNIDTESPMTPEEIEIMEANQKRIDARQQAKTLPSQP